jgi:DNA-directed RNA polymerase specialized sigma24 family protein
MVRALQHLHTFRGDAPFSNWLFRITVRTCLELMRKRTRRPEVPLDGTVVDRAAAAPTGDDSRMLIASLLDGCRRLCAPP